MQRIIGIDFGTSTTYMNIKRYNGAQPDGDKFSYIPVMFNHGESSGYVATIVRENADGSFDFGEKASEPLEGAKIHTEIKMRLESSDEQECAEARRITREFFKFLHGQYAQQTANLGGADDAEETVISYPVKWKKETAQFMLDAAQDAGFQNVRGMDEAEAAVATVLCQNSGGTSLIYADKPGYLMLIDMGAGTTDLVVCRYEASPNGEIAIELVTSWPHSADEPAFGGREIDAALERYVEGYLEKSLKPTFVSNAHDMATTPGAAKQWKERNVSAALAEDKTVNTCTYLSVYKTMGILTGDFPAFGRREFESFAESGLRDYARLIRGCLEKTAEADENFSALDLVILTGGHSAWYFAKEMLTGAMDGWLDHPALAAVRENFSRVVSLPNPQTTVSLGLVYSKLPFKLAKYEKPQKTAKPAEVPHPVEDCYKWDPQLVPVIKHFIQESPAFARQNELRNTALVVQMSKNFQLDSSEEIFYVHNWGQGPYRGIWGHVITSAGIRANAGANAMAARFMTWWEFLNSHFEYQYDSQQKENHVVISGKGVKVAFRGDQADSIGELHNLLRERAINLQKASAPKAPLQISTQPSEKKSYKWDDRLLSIVKQFIQQDPVIRFRNQIHRYPDHQKLWRQVERNLNFEIYCVVESGNNNKHIICSDGLYVNYYQGYIFGYSYGPNLGIVPWDVFLNGYLDDPNSFEGEIVQKKFGLGGSLCKLQALLREEASKELKEETVSTSPVPIVILPFDAKAMITAMDMQAVLVMLELGTDDTVTIDDRDLPLYQKIRTAEVEKDGYVLVVKEVDPNSVLDSWLFSVRCFGEDMGVMNLEQFEELYGSKMPQQKAPVAPTSGKADWESMIRQVMAMTRITSDPRTNKNTGMLRQVCQVRGGETVLLSFDNTTTQNGKGGVVLTDKAIYTRQWPFSPDRYLWKVFAKYDPCQASYGGINVGHIGIPYCNEAFHDFIWKLNQHMKG